MIDDGPCIACGAYDGDHDRGCFLEEPTRQPFTPAETRDLRIIRDRALADGGDNAPMTFVSYSARPTNGRAGAAFTTSRTVIPWIDALNMEVPQ